VTRSWEAAFDEALGRTMSPLRPSHQLAPTVTRTVEPARRSWIGRAFARSAPFWPRKPVRRMTSNTRRSVTHDNRSKRRFRPLMPPVVARLARRADSGCDAPFHAGRSRSLNCDTDCRSALDHRPTSHATCGTRPGRFRDGSAIRTTSPNNASRERQTARDRAPPREGESSRGVYQSADDTLGSSADAPLPQAASGDAK
jgi:hypothetical protein